jgi:hypothetical protein
VQRSRLEKTKKQGRKYPHGFTAPRAPSSSRKSILIPLSPPESKRGKLLHQIIVPNISTTSRIEQSITTNPSATTLPPPPPLPSRARQVRRKQPPWTPLPAAAAPRSRGWRRTGAATCCTTCTATSSRSLPSTPRPSAPSAAAPTALSGALPPLPPSRRIGLLSPFACSLPAPLLDSSL